MAVSKLVDIWSEQVTNVERFGEGVTGRNKKCKFDLLFLDQTPQDFDANGCIPMFNSAGDRMFVTCRWNKRTNQAHVIKLASSIAENGVVYEERGKPHVRWSFPRQPPFQVFSWGHTCEAIYLALSQWPSNPECVRIRKEGLKYVQLYSARVPLVSLQWAKTYCNSWGEVLAESVYEWLIDFCPLKMQWSTASKVILKITSDDPEYHKTMLDFYLKLVTKDVRSYLRKKKIDESVSGIEKHYSKEKLRDLVSLSTAVQKWGLLDALRHYHGENVDDGAAESDEFEDPTQTSAVAPTATALCDTLYESKVLAEKYGGPASECPVPSWRTLFQGVLFFQLQRRMLPHRNGAPQYTDTVFCRENKFGLHILKKVFDISLSGSEVAQLELDIVSGNIKAEDQKNSARQALDARKCNAYLAIYNVCKVLS